MEEYEGDVLCDFTLWWGRGSEYLMCGVFQGGPSECLELQLCAAAIHITIKTTMLKPGLVLWQEETLKIWLKAKAMFFRARMREVQLKLSVYLP